MKIRSLHSWKVTPTEAVALQRKLACRIDASTPLRRCDLIAGADISYNRSSTTFYASVVVLRTGDWTIVEKQSAVGKCDFPYVPGLLTFREGPILLKAFAKLKVKPDLIMFDGQGQAHPRRFGLASHMGLWLNRPSVGCAKSLLVGHFDEPELEAGSTTPLVAKQGELIGQVVRTRAGVQPVYVSVGHKIDLESSVRQVLSMVQGYRIPEPTRLAHLHVNELRRRVGG